MSIGSNIKALRRAKNLTQEDLAEYLGVSSKAVSQWECDRTAPDISQIPSLCNFFNTTADHLLDIDISKNTANIKKILDDEYKLAKNGRHDEAWELLMNAIKKYPSDYEIMHSILYNSVFILNSGKYSEKEEEKIKDECKRYCDMILDGCTDDNIRHTAIDHLCDYYAEKGDMDKAREMALKMPIMCQSQDFIFSTIYKGDYGKKCKQNLTHNLIQFLSNRITQNYLLDSGELLYSADEVAALRDKLISLLSLLFEEGDLGFFHVLLCGVHRDQARLYYAKKKDKKMVLHHLNCAAQNAVQFIKFMESDSITHSSLLFKTMEESSNGVMFSNKDNCAMITLKHLDLPEYDFMKDCDEFNEIRKLLTPYAGRNDYE